jgi:hypothetical protein
MTKRKLALKSAALCSAIALMTGYVIFQASGGEGKLLPGSKSRAIASKPPSSNPTTAPASTTGTGAIFSGSKSAMIVDPSQITAGSGGTVVVGPIVPSTHPTLMPGSKSIVLINPSSNTIDASSGTIILAPSTQPSTQPIIGNLTGSGTLNLASGTIVLSPATQPATKPSEHPATAPSK